MMAPSTHIDSLIAQARQAATNLLHSAVASLPAIRSAQGALEELHGIEVDFGQIAYGFKELERAGLIKASDAQGFEQLRLNLVAAQRRVLTFVRRIFADRPEVLQRLPSSVTPPPQLGSESYNTLSVAMAVTGVEESAAGAGVVAGQLAPWMIAGIILAALVALGMLVYLGSRLFDTFDGIRDIFVLRSQVEAAKAMYEARLQALQQCIADHHDRSEDPQECYGLVAETFPTPPELGVGLPNSGSSSALWWFIGGGVAVLGLLGLGWWLSRRKHSRYERELDGFHELPADSFLDAKDGYQLEVVKPKRLGRVRKVRRR